MAAASPFQSILNIFSRAVLDGRMERGRFTGHEPAR
jgi:hypothetical protein